jgi:molybdopterin molybdotransferase
MLEFEEARKRVLKASKLLGSERVPLEKALGRVLREDLSAEVPLPPFDYSAMDGYCLSVTSLTGTPPFELEVAGVSRTGHPCPPLPLNSALRIFTGARLPEGADAVVIQENTERDGDKIRFSSTPRRGDHVRRRGEGLERGAVGLAAGTRLLPFQLGLAAALDRASVTASRRPRVLVLPSGDELRAPGEPSVALVFVARAVRLRHERVEPQQEAHGEDADAHEDRRPEADRADGFGADPPHHQRIHHPHRHPAQLRENDGERETEHRPEFLAELVEGREHLDLNCTG